MLQNLFIDLGLKIHELIVYWLEPYLYFMGYSYSRTQLVLGAVISAAYILYRVAVVIGFIVLFAVLVYMLVRTLIRILVDVFRKLNNYLH